MKCLSLLLSIILIPAWALSQAFIENKANNAYENYSFQEVIKLNKFLFDEGNHSQIVLKKLANAHFYNADYTLAGYYFDMLFNNFDSLAINDVYRYFQTLRISKRYQQANKLIEDYCDLSEVYNHHLAYLLADSLVQKEEEFNIRKISFNSSQSEFVTSFYRKDHVFIASARDTGVFKYRVHQWNNKSFLDLYIANINSQTGEVQKLKKLSRTINSKYHESSTAFNPLTRTLYFTQNMAQKSPGNHEKIIRIGIFQTTENNDGSWQPPIVLPFCNDTFSVAHPALSPDGKRLYFSSDMPGGYGSSDLYYIELVNGNVHGTPVNLGKNINTPGRETFPFVDQNGILYFASDGRQGYGGLDLYRAKPRKEVAYDCPVNLGGTINSIADDFSFIINDEGNAGYFASNRNNSAYDDDIYYFTIVVLE